MKLKAFRLLTLFFRLLALLAGLNTAAQQPAFLTNGLVAYYPFNGNANDESGNGNHGVLDGAEQGQDRFGNLNKASFLSSTGRISVSNFHFPSGDATVSLWFRPMQTAPAAGATVMNWATGTLQQFNASYLNNGPFLISRGPSSSFSAPLGALTHWHHAVYVKQGTTQKYYYDGKIIQTNSTVAFTNEVVSTLTFGPGTHGGPDAYNGELDDVRVYNWALTDSQAQTLHEYENTPPDNNFLTNGLVAYYPFNGNANDASGNGNNGINKGALMSFDQFGRPGHAYEFDGVTNHIELPQSTVFDSTDYTITLWFNAFRFPSSGALEAAALISKGRNNFELMLSPSPNNSNHGISFLPRQPEGISQQWYAPDDVFDTNVWTHLVATYEGSSKIAQFFLNGQLLSSTYASGADSTNNTGPALIGTRYDGSLPFQGQLDDVRIYNRAFSGSEAKALYVYEGTPPDNSFITNGLVAYYPLNGNAIDVSGHSNNGVVAGAVSTLDRFGQTGSSLSFNGSGSDYVHVNNSSSFSFQKGFAISTWVFIDDGGTENPRVFSKGWSPSANEMILNGAGTMPNSVSLGQSGNGTGYGATSSNVLQHGIWYLVTCVGDLNTSSVYINGVLDSYVVHNKGSIPTNSVDVFLGRNSERNSDYFAGRLDDVRIYDRALSSGEVKALFVYESTPRSDLPRTATATAEVFKGFVVSATVVDGGSGYTNNPSVILTGGGGSGAVATATVLNGVVTAVTITDAGIGYTTTPTVIIAPPPMPPRRAAGVASITNGSVGEIAVTDSGYGYPIAPAVRLSGGGGTGATAVAVINNGVVTSFNIVSAGSGYTNTPTVRIASPPFAPSVGIAVSRVNVTLHLVLGYRYQMESSADLGSWAPVGASFVAEEEEAVQEFVIAEYGRYFRVQQVP